MNKENQKNYICNILSITEQKEYLQNYYKDINGYAISSKDKQNMKEESKNLVYGDIDFDGLLAILEKI